MSVKGSRAQHAQGTRRNEQARREGNSCARRRPRDARDWEHRTLHNCSSSTLLRRVHSALRVPRRKAQLGTATFESPLTLISSSQSPWLSSLCLLVASSSRSPELPPSSRPPHSSICHEQVTCRQHGRRPVPRLRAVAPQLLARRHQRTAELPARTRQVPPTRHARAPPPRRAPLLQAAHRGASRPRRVGTRSGWMSCRLSARPSRRQRRRSRRRVGRGGPG